MWIILFILQIGLTIYSLILSTEHNTEEIWAKGLLKFPQDKFYLWLNLKSQRWMIS